MHTRTAERIDSFLLRTGLEDNEERSGQLSRKRLFSHQEQRTDKLRSYHSSLHVKSIVVLLPRGFCCLSSK